MCEFTVYLLGDNPKDRQMMAKGILVARRKEGKVRTCSIELPIRPNDNYK
jgi:hypothetical protein